jgi:hypothetical protein
MCLATKIWIEPLQRRCILMATQPIRDPTGYPRLYLGSVLHPGVFLHALEAEAGRVIRPVVYGIRCRAFNVEHSNSGSEIFGNNFIIDNRASPRPSGSGSPGRCSFESSSIQNNKTIQITFIRNCMSVCSPCHRDPRISWEMTHARIPLARRPCARSNQEEESRNSA